MNKPVRIGIGVIFVLSVMIIALVVGMLIGGQCCTPADSGLAGGAIVVGYGVITSVVAGLIAICIAIYAPTRGLLYPTIALAFIGSIVGGALLRVYFEAQAEMAAHLQEAHENMLKYRVTLSHTAAAPEQPFKTIQFDWGQRQYTAVVEKANSARTCTATLSGEQGVMMLGALREVDLMVYNDSYPCAGTLGEVLHHLDMFIPEGTPPDSEAKLAITAACLERYPALAQPFAVAQQIYRANRSMQSCE